MSDKTYTVYGGKRCGGQILELGKLLTFKDEQLREAQKEIERWKSAALYYAEKCGSMRKWIPVSERLPDKKKVIDGDVYYRNVAVRIKNRLHETIAYYDPEHECWYDTGFFQIRGITHWAELPEWESIESEAQKG